MEIPILGKPKSEKIIAALQLLKPTYRTTKKQNIQQVSFLDERKFNKWILQYLEEVSFAYKAMYYYQTRYQDHSRWFVNYYRWQK